MKFIPELYKTEQTAVKNFFDKNTIYCTFATEWDIIWCFCVLTNREYSDTMNLKRLPGRENVFGMFMPEKHMNNRKWGH